MAYSRLGKRTPVSVVETGTFVRQVDALLSTASREESRNKGRFRRRRRPFGKSTWRGDDGEFG